ncbi:unnamed protein product [Phytophthora fragariaefolia]|uniref:Unnamed protein product n=1 Tax=Phytophthora fragariaefolia TaxID=1490495 RepID=A0A9W6YES3_9STRA|nr:unnamed protein product [Phytophthora fragariaefolia]
MRIVDDAGYENFVVEREDKTGKPEVLIAHVSFLVSYHHPVSLLQQVATGLEAELDEENEDENIGSDGAATGAAVCTATDHVAAAERVAVQQRHEQFRNDEEAERAARGQHSQRVADWWRPDDDANGILLDSTCWSTSSERQDGVEAVRTAVDVGGCSPTSLNASGKTVGSWNTPLLRKSCNRAATSPMARNDGRNDQTVKKTCSRAATWVPDDARNNGRTTDGADPEDHRQ